uniref:Helicase-associated domain-containing protein n=1 Tax=Hanusia phi TaxID=3032 RepID=A0A7S0HPV7_9CRYP
MAEGPLIHAWGGEGHGAFGGNKEDEVHWEENFQRFLEYKKTLSSSNRKRRLRQFPSKGTPLRRWIDQQRRLFKHGELEEKRSRRLSESGLDLSSKGKLREIDWESMYQQLRGIYLRNGHCRLGSDASEQLLVQWADAQRTKFIKGTLSSEKQHLLDGIGFPWYSEWFEMFNQACLMYQNKGVIDLSERTARSEDSRVAYWLRTQGNLKLEGFLTGTKEILFDSLNFDDFASTLLDSDIARDDSVLIWQPRYERLILFKQIYGHCNITIVFGDYPAIDSNGTGANTTSLAPAFSTKGKEALVQWYLQQIDRARRGKMSSSRRNRLEDLGVYLESEVTMASHTEWTQRIEELRNFKKQHGHCSVPVNYDRNPALARWVHTQRMRRRKGKMSASRAKQLERLGFSFEGRSQWEKRYLELIAFRDRYGHCSPSQLGHFRKLGVWVAVQRVKSRKGQLRESRKQKLDAIGFRWELHTDWETRVFQLRSFREKHGHCNVPQQLRDESECEIDRSLGTWVTMQRMKRRAGKLTQDQIRELDSLGFRWGIHTDWELRFQELLDFRNQHGHCNVPQKYKSNPSLGAWVAQQRRRFKHMTLTWDKVKRMEKAGIEWQLRRGRHASGPWMAADSSTQQDESVEVKESDMKAEVVQEGNTNLQTSAL